MIELKFEKDFSKTSKISFCYICGHPFSNKKDKTRDHVPPASIFQPLDKSPSLILPAHEYCNRGQSTNDEEISKLIGLLYGEKLPKNSRLKAQPLSIEFKLQIGVSIELDKIIFRWVRGFHAALYNEFLPDDTKKSVHPTMPSGIIEGNTVYNNENRLRQHYKAVAIIKKNRAVEQIDRIECRNKQCVYECVWQESGTQWMCVFALNICDWKKLGNSKDFAPRGCVGFYFPENGCPNKAAKGTTMEIPILNHDRLDPFAI
jgi:hypothetical protein